MENVSKLPKTFEEKLLARGELGFFIARNWKKKSFSDVNVCRQPHILGTRSAVAENVI